MAIYRVVKADGRKLWLATEEKKPRTGWVLSDQVVLVDESIPFVRDQIQANPKDPFPFLIRATVWRDAGELDIAIADYSDAIRLDPNSSPHTPGADTWTGTNDLDKAIADYSEAIRLDPKFVAAYLGAGMSGPGKTTSIGPSPTTPRRFGLIRRTRSHMSSVGVS